MGSSPPEVLGSVAGWVVSRPHDSMWVAQFFCAPAPVNLVPQWLQVCLDISVVVLQQRLRETAREGTRGGLWLPDVTPREGSTEKEAE